MKLKLLAAAATIGAALTATAPAFAQEKLVVWWGKGFYKAEDDALFAAIKKFEAKYPKVKVELSLYAPQEAIKLAKEASFTKFDETVELHLRMNLDPRTADHQIRGIALLPHGLGKKIRVLVFAQGEAVSIAEKAGADSVGADDLIKKIEGGWTDLDVTVATPDLMSKIGKLGKSLGTRGLMPNPKAGTRPTRTTSSTCTPKP